MKTTIPARLLVIEDDKSIPLVLDSWLKKHSDNTLVIDHATTMEEGLSKIQGAACILLDLTIPPNWRPENTLHLVPKIREEAPVIILTGYSTGSSESDSEFACDAMSEYGADRVFFKNSLIDTAGIGLLFSAVTAAMCRRIYEKNHR